MKTMKYLSDTTLLRRLQRACEREHKCTIEVVELLVEFDRRDLYLELGYGSLFDFCTKQLKYSASAAVRRIQVARCAARNSEVLPMLCSHEASLTTIHIVASILTPDNKHDVLERIKHRTQREVEAIASQYRPPIVFRDRVQPVRVAVPPAHRPDGSGARACEKSNYNRSGGRLFATSSSEPAGRTEDKLLIRFLANPAFIKKYEAVRALLSQRLEKASFERVFEAVLDEFLERHSPEHRHARRRVRASRAKAVEMKAAATRNPPAPPLRAPHRHIPAAVRDAVFMRSNGACAYVGKDGRQCKSTHALQIDHIIPVARGGTTAPSNLRLLCAKHNRLAAVNVMGDAARGHIPKGE